VTAVCGTAVNDLALAIDILPAANYQQVKARIEQSRLEAERASDAYFKHREEQWMLMKDAGDCSPPIE
jgi:hypothetical protein